MSLKFEKKNHRKTKFLGVKQLGLIALKKVTDRYTKLREAERKISSNFGPKRMVGFRVMTKKPKKLTTKKATTIKV